LGVGRRFIAPNIPAFKAKYDQINLRLRLSDRDVDIGAEGRDVAFHLGPLADSSLKMRQVAACSRLLCASPDYIKRRGMPMNGDDLVNDKHDCLNLRFPGSSEFQWTLETDTGPRKFSITGPYETDDGDVLTSWAISGNGIVMKPEFEVADHLRSGALVPVATQTPPVSTQLVCLYHPRKMKEAKVRLFVDFMIERCKTEMRAAITGP
jgi:DNA-binding transcriptional LysR family regulator